MSNQSDRVTYRLYTTKNNILAYQEHFGARLLISGPKGLLLAYRDEAVPPKDWIRGQEPGWPAEPQEHEWLKNALELAQAEYEASFPVVPAKQRAAVAAFRRARRNLDALEDQIAKAKRAEHLAAAAIVRTHGNAPIQIDGVTYDPSSVPSTGTIYLIPRSSYAQGYPSHRRQIAAKRRRPR